MTTNLHRAPRLGAVLLLGMSLALAACSGGPGTGSPTPSGTPGASPSGNASPSAPGSADSSASAAPTDDQGPFACALPIASDGTVVRAQITDIRVGTHSGYDRIVFEFADGIPPYRIEDAMPPFIQDPSGLPMNVSGSAFWKITLNGGTIVSPDGGVTYDGPTTFTPGFPKLVELARGGDFEAVSTWYIGLSDISCIRVQTLTAPSRLVVDIQH